MIKRTWQIAYTDRAYDPDRTTKLLSDGWQPFAATPNLIYYRRRKWQTSKQP